MGIPTLGSALAGGSTTQPYSGLPQSGQGPGSAASAFIDGGSYSWAGYRSRVQLREVMTAGVLTAGPEAAVLEVARLMRDHAVGSVVICDHEGAPAAMVTDRDLTVRALAEERDPAEPAADHASRPLISADPEMDLEEAAALMVSHRVRRLPVVEGERLIGIVTLDDIAVRTGDLEVAQRMTQEVIEGALPGFFFHERG